MQMQMEIAENPTEKNSFSIFQSLAALVINQSLIETTKINSLVFH